MSATVAPLPSAASSVEEGKSADLVLRGGRVHCLDLDASVCEAIAVRAGRIVATGSDADIAAFLGPATEVVELAGRAVLPGINDAHLHAVWMGARWPKTLFEEGGGEGAHGKLLSNAEERKQAILKAWSVMASLGITSYTEPGIGPGEDDGETGCFGTPILETYLELAGTAAQTARVTLLRLFGILDGPSDFASMRRSIDVEVRAADPNWLAIPGVKIFADGIPPMRNAWLRDPYPGGGHGGLMTGSGDDAERLADFTAMVELAHARRLQVAVHATGDRTIEEFIAIVERLGGADGLRHYVIHGDLVTPEQLARMKQAGMGLALQPLIADLTRDWMAQAVGPATAARAWPLHLMLAKGMRVVLSSDAPVTSPDWRRSIASAASQLEAQGVAVGGEILTELLRMYTAIPADQDGALDWKGTIEVGKVADLCVLDRDPYTTGARNFSDIEVDLTIVDGRTVFDRLA